MAQVAEHLPTIREVLCSNSTIGKTKTKNTKHKKQQKQKTHQSTPNASHNPDKKQIFVVASHLIRLVRSNFSVVLLKQILCVTSRTTDNYK
jgi:hypothetical protein